MNGRHVFLAVVALYLVTIFVLLAMLTQMAADAAAPELEPYGGCEEAFLYPDSPGGRWCAEHDLLPGQQR